MRTIAKLVASISKATTAVLAVLLFSAFHALPAIAGCSPFQVPNSGARVQPQSWEGRAAFQLPSFTLISSHSDSDSIVGFWNVTITSDGQVIDSAYVQWHSDGTEIMNSSRDPRSGNFCMGVWKKVGNSYVLNHFAKSWDSDGNLIGPAHVRQRVRVDQGGQSYSGVFTLDQYDTSGNLLIHLAGEVSATRITVDTPPSKSF
jgi:hypothetical protein